MQSERVLFTSPPTKYINIVYRKTAASAEIGAAVFIAYTKHHLKFGKNQADNLVAVENRFI